MTGAQTQQVVDERFEPLPLRCPDSGSTSRADPTFTTIRRAEARGEWDEERCADMVRKTIRKRHRLSFERRRLLIA